MLYYDYCLTFEREIEHFWKRARFTVVSTLFVTNRYLGLLGPIPVVLEYFTQLPSPVSVRSRRTQLLNRSNASCSGSLVQFIMGGPIAHEAFQLSTAAEISSVLRDHQSGHRRRYVSEPPLTEICPLTRTQWSSLRARLLCTTGVDAYWSLSSFWDVFWLRCARRSCSPPNRALTLQQTTFIATNVKTIAVTANASSEHTAFGCDLSLTAEQ